MENIGDMLFGPPPAPKEGEEVVKQKPIKARSLREIRGSAKEPSIVLGAEITSGLKRRNKAFSSLRAQQMKRTMGMYSGSPTSYTPMKRAGDVKTAMDFFGKRYGKHIAAGIVGNLMVESGGFDPNVIAGKRKGDQGKAFGVAQWHPDRQANFQKAFGKPIAGSSLTEQLQFIEWELNNTETKAKKRLLGARTAEDAAEIFDRHYERSSGQHRQRRIDEASRLFGM